MEGGAAQVAGEVHVDELAERDSLRAQSVIDGSTVFIH